MTREQMIDQAVRESMSPRQRASFETLNYPTQVYWKHVIRAEYRRLAEREQVNDLLLYFTPTVGGIH